MTRTLICSAHKLHLVNRRLPTATAAIAATAGVIAVVAVVAVAVIALIGVNFCKAASVMRCDAC